ncbi:type IV secretory system conjugative DNA transfer family protein [Mycoplasma seminis]|uniref:Type IV secretory system conjugative DNA transfer family protein n=1 Tax=Mycoplasma seminis TaxID=512749 RepID=A0ABY9H9G7_9MOLU|nr:type IV secretory system conjugative DNA transfer family protein [Mycoplasma seminis]WLP85223.1 type IV secretory system conjugative DNA transfer family protein [Mycoplasma seminis]
MLARSNKFWLIIKLFLCFGLIPLVLTFLMFVILQIFVSGSGVVKQWILKETSFWTGINVIWSVDAWKMYRLWNVLIPLIGSLCSWLYLIIYPLIKNKKSKADENDGWLYNEETSAGSWSKFKKTFKGGINGFCLGRIKNKFYANKNDTHSIIIGTAGSGKTQKILLPNIEYLASIKDKSNMVISDPKGEILASSGNILLQNGYKIVVLDLSDTRKSIKWNPLKLAWEQVHNKPKEAIGEYEISRAYENIAEVVDATLKSISQGNQENNIWERQGKNIIELVLKFMLLYSLEDETFTLNDFSLANVMYFLNENYFKKGKWIEILQKYRYKNDEWKRIYTSWETYFSTNKDTFTSMLANSTDLCSKFASSPEIVQLTSKDNFDFKAMLRDTKQPFAVYIKYNDAETNKKFLISLFITQLYQNAIAITQETNNGKLSVPLRFMLEEFNSLPNVDIANWMSISRSRKIFFCLVLQDFEQLAKYGGRDKTDELIKNQARLLYYLETNSINTLETISKLLGKKTIKRKSTTTSKSGTSENVSEQEKELLSVDELKNKNSKNIIVFTAGNKPVMIAPQMFYEYHKNETVYENDFTRDDIEITQVFDFDTFSIQNVEEEIEEINIQPLMEKYNASTWKFMLKDKEK